MNVAVWAILSILSGVFGRLGGWEHGNRLFRMLGVPACCCAMLSFYHWHWSIIICFGTVLGATSTYFKSKNQPVKWWNWLLVGMVEGLALFPYVLFTHDWLGFAIRTAVCALLVCLWDELCGIDWLEEGVRYFIIAATIPLLFISF